MVIEPKYIKIRDLLKGYVNDPEKGVYAYNGKLNIRHHISVSSDMIQNNSKP